MNQKELTQAKEKKAKVKKLIYNILLAVILAGLIVFVIFSDRIITDETSPLYEVTKLKKVFDSNLLNSLIYALVYAVVVIVVYRVLSWVLQLTMARTQRGKTVVNLLNSFIKYAFAIIGILLVLSAFGVDTTTLLASAGILALVIGLGAQNLIEDILAGLFIVFEGEYSVGDIIVIDGFRGTVTEIGIRTTELTDASGNIKIVNNSDIRNIINMSSELSLAICDVSIEYGESIERVETIIQQNLDKVSERIPAIIEGPYYKGVAQLAESGVVIKFIAKCKEDDRYQVERDLNREIKIIFDKNNINIPFPQVVVNQPKEYRRVTENTRNRANEFVDQQKEASKDIEDEQNT
ncbi:MAG: mechanosensitive ion channel family protein [Clostridia bacterium]|nr:mechanosensitive ion channel family protein [Clostridia bacterium]